MSQAQDQATAHERSKCYHLDVDSFSLMTDGDLLTEYLESPMVRGCADPIQYWSSLLVGGDPRAQMALDFLLAPAASTDVECAFSHGGLTVSKRQHALSNESVCSATVLGSWAGVADLIPEDEIIGAMKERNK
ncbi:hypothetical protein QCA50_016671 [Cerrena zonata]|uniref:HAT C-terminal dimerisation domain-containing protein n=1 Tax=Cerrena zonata TaxID=2478898 RepID=A0AAW0FLG0_9APHY